MQPETVAGPAPDAASARSDRAAMFVVHATWLVLLAGALAAVALWGRNLPLSEDWLTVAPLTGNEPDLAGWLWAQNNEHRIPLPRLLYLAVLSASGGDYRSGMVFNVVALGVLSLALMRAARRVRGSTHYADAFFPLVLLHLGHWENMVWGWQIQFVLSVVLTCALLLVVVRDRVPGPASGLAAGACLVLLPLSGANGVVVTVALAPWFAWLAWRALRTGSARPAAAGLLLCVAMGLALCVAYLAGYERPTWNPPSPGPLATARTTAKLLALGLGPAATHDWWVSTSAVALLLGSAAFLLIRPQRAAGPADLPRRYGLLAFLAATAVLALAIGHGRAGTPPHPHWGLPIRYALLGLPPLLVCHFAWTLYGPVGTRRYGLWALLASALFVLPFNTMGGLRWRDWYVAGADLVRADLRSGAPLARVADRHYPFLLHWDRDFLLSRLEMLQEAGMGPFRELQLRDGGPRERPSGTPVP